MADSFEEVIGHIVHVGAREFSAIAIIEDVIRPFLPAGADDRLRAAVTADAREQFVRLQQRVQAIEAQLHEHGRQLEDLGAKRTVAVAQDVAKGIAEAYSVLKIEAVLNAGARQFDPRLGDAATRKFWLDRAARLQDLEVRVLLLLKQRAPLYYFHPTGQLYWGNAREAADDLSEEERVAVGSTLDEMFEAHELVGSNGANASFGEGSSQGRVLTPRGAMLVRFIEPIPGA